MFKCKNKFQVKQIKCNDGFTKLSRLFTDGTKIVWYKLGPYEITPIYDKHSSAPCPIRYGVNDGEVLLRTVDTINEAKDFIKTLCHTFW